MVRSGDGRHRTKLDRNFAAIAIDDSGAAARTDHEESPA